jgi:NTP pyrophosphatase (non-canonical NTP hydrolase)
MVRNNVKITPMDKIKLLTQKIIAFRDARDWKQFHNSKDVALSLSLEAAEVLEHFQWKNEKEIKAYIKKYKSHIGEELADVFYWVLLMSHDLEIDIEDALEKKIKKNALKYPVKKAKGKHTKYNQL